MRNTWLILLSIALIPAASWAGTPRPEVSAPVLSDIGILIAGASMIGVGGFGILRRPKR